MSFPDSEYTIVHMEHGMLVKGSIPAEDFTFLADMAKERGFTLIDAGIASALGATMAFVSAEGSDKWRKEIEESNKAKDREVAWLRGTDTGTSSLTIFSVLARCKHMVTSRHVPDIPYDIDDFGRCHRLLERFPEWRARLPEVAKAHPRWKRLVAAWPTLTALYEEALDSEEPSAPTRGARVSAKRRAERTFAVRIRDLTT